MRENKQLILIADADPRQVQALREYLTTQDYEVLCAYDGEQALDIFYSNMYDIDLILLDVMMPKLDGISVLKIIRHSSLVPVIFLADKEEEYEQIRSFHSGADDYIVKPLSQTALVYRIEALMRRSGKTLSRPLTAGNIIVDQMRRMAAIDGTQMNLTRREFDLLVYFISNKGRALSREQLLNGAWGYDFDGDPRTVDTHVKQLRSKLGDYAYCLETRYRIGYQFQPPIVQSQESPTNAIRSEENQK